MGMFDYVNVKINCDKCGCELNFQTKDSDCYMQKVDPDGLSCFYAWCCGRMVTYSRLPLVQKPPREVPFSHDEVIKMGFELK